MRSYPGWQYNEMKQVGTDYNDPAQVEIYDSQMGTLRDIKKENEEIIKTLIISLMTRLSSNSGQVRETLQLMLQGIVKKYMP